jgi:myosin heavy subunit
MFTASVASQFRTQLDALMKTLATCTPHFVRCINPNTAKAPLFFDGAYVYAQLRYGTVD